MPVRSITVKLIVPRKKGHLESCRDLWSTHAAVNGAVEYYESLLLELRGGEYLVPDGTIISSSEVNAQLRNRVVLARTRNGRLNPLTDTEFAEISRYLRRLYEAIVPSSIGEKGDAQQANAYISPLTDADSMGFLSIFDKISTPPEWLGGVRCGEAEAFEDAVNWLATEDGKKRMEATGAPPKWVKMARSGEAGWPVAFVADFDKKLAEVEGVPTIIRTLKEKKVLPLFAPYLAPKIEDSEGRLSRWDRLAFRLAVGHLLSWESWCRISAEDHALRKRRLEDFCFAHLESEGIQAAVASLHRYEQERTKELTRISLAPIGGFNIRTRMVRSWAELREKWLGQKDRSREHLMSISVDMQAKLRGKFGDPHLFSWLAQPENHHVWDTGTDAVMLFAKANALSSLLDRSRERAVMTLPDPVRHPRSAQWEPEGGSNLKNYSIILRNGTLYARLPLLRATPVGTLTELEQEFPVAPTGQFREPVIASGKKGVVITYRNQTGETLTGSLNSADLLFSWDYFKHRDAARLSAGNIGPAYLKLVVEIDQKLPEGWDGKRHTFVNHFSAALGNEKHAESVSPGQRILSVDLGLRCFASCSVFELKDSKPSNGKLSYPAGVGLWAVHERSFMLRLPGEEVDAQGEMWRRTASDDLRGLRRMLNRYRTLYRLDGIDDEIERTRVLNEMLEAFAIHGHIPFERALVGPLCGLTGSDREGWIGATANARQSYKEEMGLIIGEWRRGSKVRDTRKAMGKSMWAIEYLTDVRRFLVGWSLLGDTSGEIRRLDRGGRGVFARRLLNHIDGVKKDRLKTGADLIVQAARGYLRDENSIWNNKYAPCHAVLFEDLSRYRMKTDRPRRENSQLMLWSHREMTGEVAMQGELYGISQSTTDAAFSSRYHAASMAPGVRCHPFTLEDTHNAGLKFAIEAENHGISWESLKPGDLVPLSGGEIFSCLGKNGIVRINADVNAAQNLQRRFWTRYEEQIRVTSRKVSVNGEVRWIPRTMGKRLMGAMGGCGWLVPTGDESGSCRWEKLTSKQWKSLGGGILESEAPDELDDGNDLLGIEEDILETSGEVTVFFRDPSGVVLSASSWFPGKFFWGTVKGKTSRAIMGLISAES